MSQSVSPALDPAQDPRTSDILDIVAKETRLDRGLLTLDASIESLGIPSLDMVQTIFEIESRYDVEIPVVSDQAGAEFRTIGDLVAHALRAIDAAEAARRGTAEAGRLPGTATG
jgi:acyl carrier protein